MNKTAIRLIAISAVAGLGIAGCSSKKSTPSAASSSPAAATSSAAPAPSAASSSAAAASTPAAPASSAPAAGGGAQVGVILPDTQSSSRWEQQDTPNLKKAFDAAGVKADIQNALGDKAKFVSIGQSMIQEGVKVLIVVDLDSPSGAQVEAAAAKAGIKTIDYDRLTLGGGASYYVSFDNVKVGQLQGQGLVDCMTAAKVAKPIVIELKGSPTDNNATLFAQGYDGVLDPLYAAGTYVKKGEQAVPNWDNAQAGTIFENLLTAAGGKVDGVIAANDGMGQSVITVSRSTASRRRSPVRTRPLLVCRAFCAATSAAPCSRTPHLRRLARQRSRSTSSRARPRTRRWSTARRTTRRPTPMFRRSSRPRFGSRRTRSRTS